MARTPDLDSNQWYHMYVTSGPGQALMGSRLGRGKPGAAVQFNPTNTTRTTQRWQVFQLNSTTWTLRCQESGPNAWLGATGTIDDTAPYLARGDVAGADAFWTIASWGDETWFLSNAANGTGSHLQKNGNGLLVMSPNITAPQSGQRWSFNKIEAIDDQQYSTINLLGAVVSTSTIASGSPSPSATSTPSTTTNASDSSSSSGLSIGAQAAIGASIGGAALIALVVLGLFLWRKRKQRQSKSSAPQEPIYEALDSQAQSPPLTKYEMYHDGAAHYEMPSNSIAEVPMNERPAELPGHAMQR